MDAAQWVEARLPTQVVHLDAAAAGRTSREVLEVQVAHLRREAETGAYVAHDDAVARIDEGRAALAARVGLRAGDVCFLDGAGTAFATLLDAWPLPRRARIGTVRSEYGANARVLDRLARQRDWQLVELAVDDVGRITSVPTDLDLVTFPHVSSQRGILQPVEDVFATGTPLLLDVAQSLGQVAVPAGCAAYVGTSRKWLCGPRGVGFAVVDPHVQAALQEPATLAPTRCTGMQRWEAQEAHVAGWVGFATAVEQWTPDVLPVIAERARAVRTALDGVGGWRVREPMDESTGVTTLLGGDPVAMRAALLEDGVLTSAVPVSRSADLDVPVLRVSTAAWVTPADVDALARSLHRRTK